MASRAFRFAQSAVIAATLLGMLLNVALLWRTNSGIDELQTRQRELVRQAVVLEGEIAELMSAERGFLLTSDERFAADFEEDIDDSRTAIQRIRQVGPIDRARLDEISGRIEVVAHGVRRRMELARSGQLAEATARFVQADDELRDLRALIDRFVKEEQGILLSQMGALESERFAAATIGALAILGMGAFGVLLLRRSKREAERSERRLAAAAAELEHVNRELEAFSYAVSHDLRAPLRSMDGFSLALLEDLGETLPESGRHDLGRIRAAATQMSRLIDGLLDLSKVARQALTREPLDLSALAREVASDLARATPLTPLRDVDVRIAPELWVHGDPALVRVVLQNLLGNAWKFTAKRAVATIEVGRGEGEHTFFVRDNGAGFDMAYAPKLFGTFQRLHRADEFDGTGIGLATVQRVIHRHGGRVWAIGNVEQGATFFFTLPSTP